MFDAETAKILRSAPDLPSLKSAGLPELLTRHYAALVSERLRGGVDEAAQQSSGWSLDFLADSYEVVASIDENESSRKAAAFVAATAQQIIARRQQWAGIDVGSAEWVAREYVDPRLSAVLLFLAAEQFADANEAALQIEPSFENRLSDQIARYVRNLGLGRLHEIARTEVDQVQTAHGTLEERALETLLQALLQALEMFAAWAMSPASEGPQRAESFDVIDRVIDLAIVRGHGEHGVEEEGFYPGPRHLASLLRLAFGAIATNALSKLPPPPAADPQIWARWIGARSQVQPYVWPNHKKFIDEGFHKSGVSAVLVLPTGAGKTTVASLKIAAVIAAGKRVVFLAPTHALVEQLAEDLQGIFSKDVVGSTVSADADFQDEEQSLPSIEVMTPEGCLASLCFSPERFTNVELLVFDECHLLSPLSGSFRRALDGMLCVMAFIRVRPFADFLFLSAMLEDGGEFAQWVEWLTGRPCFHVSLLWKPSRQARGVLVYDNAEVKTAVDAALKTQRSVNEAKGKKAKELGKKAQQKLCVHPYAIWGLRHNWLDRARNKASFSRQRLLDARVRLTGKIASGNLRLLPNVNEVAAQVAIHAVKAGLKTIVFVNNRTHSVSAARNISSALSDTPAGSASAQEELRWDALAAELGDLKHSVLKRYAVAVPHNAAMLRLEREIAERSYRRRDGASVIVATPTLAQGLNLPAQLAILAGDKRTDPEFGGRADLQAHELLNAAARAGRAGHLANGVVILVPDPVLVTKDGEGLGPDVVAKLQAILPEDDRCVRISDPLEVILDRLTVGESLDPDVQYTVNRLVAFSLGEEGASERLFDIQRSFAAFRSVRANREAEFDARIELLKQAVDQVFPGEVSNQLALMSAKSGLPIRLLERFRQRLALSLDSLPRSVIDWLDWLLSWFEDDIDAAGELLRGVAGSINASVGLSKPTGLSADVFPMMRPGMWAWLKGEPLSEIEFILGGAPHSNLLSEMVCPRARELVGTVMPRGISYVMGLLSMVLSTFDGALDDPVTAELVQSLSVATRKGFDSPQKVRFAMSNPTLISRVVVHREFAKLMEQADEFWSGAD